LHVPALSESALLVQATGETEVIMPVNGRYDITLEGAHCYGECYMGGPPVFLVEDGAASGPVPTSPPPAAAPTSTPEAVDGTETATSTPLSTGVPDPTATITPTQTLTPTVTSTDTPEPTATSTLEPTATSTSVPTDMPTVTATAIATVTETAVSSTATAAIAKVDEDASGGETAVFGFIPREQASWWLLGSAAVVGIVLAIVGFAKRRR
ncbi:MAG: hypothetical protein KC419_07960, partial [Anaerolineales bacterium]|nr:hypothetical protein [Anaerolineales bacterium]